MFSTICGRSGRRKCPMQMAIRPCRTLLALIRQEHLKVSSIICKAIFRIWTTSSRAQVLLLQMDSPVKGCPSRCLRKATARIIPPLPRTCSSNCRRKTVLLPGVPLVTALDKINPLAKALAIWLVCIYPSLAQCRDRTAWR
jgi:hypothetical protein